MIGRPKKPSRFRGALNNGSKKIISDETENKDFTLQSSNTILNSCRTVISFHPIDSDWQVIQGRFLEIDHFDFNGFLPSPEAGIP